MVLVGIIIGTLLQALGIFAPRLSGRCDNEMGFAYE